jgi:NRPS condensation-like uncharacterized protein
MKDADELQKIDGAVRNSEKWYRLDNAAKIFPLVQSRKDDSSCFRLAVLLYEDVIPEVLLKALEFTLTRFPTFNVQLKAGLFWYYLEQNENPVNIYKDDAKMFDAKDRKEQQDYLFKLCYYGKRISLVVFHSLSDGYGAMEFLKSIVYQYLKLNGKSIRNHSCVLTMEVEELIDEQQDSFYYNYNKNISDIEKDNNAFKIRGFNYKTNYNGVFYFIMDLDSIKARTKIYDCTITQYFGAILLLAIYRNYFLTEGGTLPIKLLIPVNIRKYFHSTTLRNFTLFIRTNTLHSGPLSLEQAVQYMKEDFAKELETNRMRARLAQNMKFEKNFWIRITPLFIKIPIAKLVHNSMANKTSTMSFSNLGMVQIPADFKKYIDRFEFVSPATLASPITGNCITFDKRVVFSLTNKVIDRKFQREVVSVLQKEGLDFVVETNDLEVM